MATNKSQSSKRNPHEECESTIAHQQIQIESLRQELLLETYKANRVRGTVAKLIIGLYENKIQEPKDAAKTLQAMMADWNDEEDIPEGILQ